MAITMLVTAILLLRSCNYPEQLARHLESPKVNTPLQAHQRVTRWWRPDMGRVCGMGGFDSASDAQT